MKLIDLLNKLHLSGDLNRLTWSKSIRDAVVRKREIYLFFNKEMLINRKGPSAKRVAIQFTMDSLKCSERAVYEAIEEMEIDIPDPSDADILSGNPDILHKTAQTLK